ncbi:predicted protein [Naegleria gruberi]|uniref:Predicted protein n=1 Tax=Naegleria gruberi TaxID=5762 RepID=D2V3N0_NAEGR|nr:uncharacterized protein NAEGRDRAFT_46427 [Naegleria gruberi]EFC48800.1 predicted protein [Naegleria gruberi]|eukprot:XP_002681544.1 predicted protein [Naegleria gruberi strain NEG-M]
MHNNNNNTSTIPLVQNTKTPSTFILLLDENYKSILLQQKLFPKRLTRKDMIMAMSYVKSFGTRSDSSDRIVISGRAYLDRELNWNYATLMANREVAFSILCKMMEKCSVDMVLNMAKVFLLWNYEPLLQKLISSPRFNIKLVEIIPKEFESDLPLETTDPSLLHYRSQELRSHKDILEVEKIFVKAGFVNFENTSDELKDDKQFVLELTEQKRNIFSYISERLKKTWNSNKEIIRKIVKLESCNFTYACDELKDDKSFVLELLEQKQTIFIYVSDGLKSDKDIVKKSVKKCGYLFEYAADELKSDKEFVLELLEQKCNIFSYISERLKECLNSNKEIIREIVKVECSNFKYACDELKDDKPFVLELLSQKHEILEYVSNRLQSDKEVVLEAVRIHPLLIEYASDELRNEPELKHYFVALDKLEEEESESDSSEYENFQ